MYAFSSAQIGVSLSALFSPLVFLGNLLVALIGMILWGIALCDARHTPEGYITSVLLERRPDLAFKLFYLRYGGGWLIGSVIAGLLYNHSRLLLIASSVAMQLASIP